MRPLPHVLDLCRAADPDAETRRAGAGDPSPARLLLGLRRASARGDPGHDRGAVPVGPSLAGGRKRRGAEDRIRDSAFLGRVPYTTNGKSRTGDFAGTKATGADVNGLVGSVDDSPNLTDVCLPGSVGFAMRVGNGVPESDLLLAKFALSHDCSPP